MKRSGRAYDKDALLEHLAGILKNYGDVSKREYNALPIRGPHSETYLNRWGSWITAKQEAKRLLQSRGENVKRTITARDEEEDRLKLEKAVLRFISKPRDTEDICFFTGLSLTKTRKLLNDLKEGNDGVGRIGETWFYEDIRRRGPDDETFIIEDIKYGRFGLISDTHFGSKFQQLTYLHEFYEKCKKAEVDFVIHAGDATEGDGSLYRGQRFEMFLHGFSEQRDYFCEFYPKFDIETYVVAGNHDESFMRSANVDVLGEISSRRTDINYLGRRGAYLNITKNKIKMYIHHPDGGTAYAISYKPQKFIENFSSENKPQVYFIGHYHTAGQFFLRNVHCFLTGCFQSQTPYLRGKGLMPEVCGWIVDYDVATDGWSLEVVNTTIVPFYRVIKDDYKRYPR